MQCLQRFYFIIFFFYDLLFAVQNGVFSEWKEFASEGANSSLLEMIPIEKRGKHENDRVASLENILFHLWLF